MIIMFNRLFGYSQSCWSKIPCGSNKPSKIMSSISIKISWSAHTATSTKDRYKGTIQGDQKVRKKSLSQKRPKYLQQSSI